MTSTQRVLRAPTFLTCLVAAFAIAAAGCGSEDSSSESASSGGSAAPAEETAEKKEVGFVVYDVGVDPWMNVAIKTVQDEGAKLGMEVDVVNGHNDVAQMNGAIDQFITQGKDAILIAPSDKDSLVSAVKRAEAKGIPSFTFSLAMSEKAPITSFIGADDVQIGREQGKMIAEAIEEKGNVALMTGILGSGPQIGRSEGIREELGKYPNIKIVEQQANNWQNDKTISLTQDWLSKYPKGQLAAIAAQGPELVAGAKLAKSKGRDEIAFVAVDYPKDARKAIQDGLLHGTLNQSPAVMAQEAMQTIAKATNKEDVPPQILIDVPPVTKDNVEEIQAGY